MTDYQLARALDLLRGLALFSQNTVNWRRSLLQLSAGSSANRRIRRTPRGSAPSTYYDEFPERNRSTAMSEAAYDPAAQRTMSDEEIAALPYRRGVGVMLLNAQNKVFVAQRLDMKTAAWQMPQGGIDPDEDPRQTAFREMKEEIGTDKARILAETDWISYDLPSDLVPKLWKGRYRGQTQKWFAMRFLGTDADIDINGQRGVFRLVLGRLRRTPKPDRTLQESTVRSVSWRSSAPCCCSPWKIEEMRAGPP